MSLIDIKDLSSAPDISPTARPRPKPAPRPTRCCAPGRRHDDDVSTSLTAPILDVEPQVSLCVPAPAPACDVAIVGMGYVGLPTALAFVAAGRSVLGLEVDPRRIATITDCAADLVERDQQRLVDALAAPQSFRLTGDASDLAAADAVIICVPTPIDAFLQPDLGPLRAACRTVVDHARPGQVLILTSTTYVGCTADLLVAPLAARGLAAGEDVAVAFSPERIDPGNDTHALEVVPRVLGGATPRCAVRAALVLEGYAAQVHLVSSPEAAEMVKLVENTFRAVNIALANEFADVSRALDLSVLEVIDAAATKPYGFMAFYPGPGVGGHCIPCDPLYLLWQLRRHRVRTPVMEQAMAEIAGRPGQVVDRARELLSDNGIGLPGTRVLVVGVTYKPDVTDVRESPALEIIQGLREAGALVAFHDPLVASVRLPDGSRLRGLDAPEEFGARLVIVLCRHAGSDLGWADDVPLVLDATFREAHEHGWATL